MALKADTTDVKAMEAAVALVVEKLGKLDVVFANAGINGVTPVGNTTLSTFEEVLNINLTGVFFTVQATAPYLNMGASVVLISSAMSVIGSPCSSAYAASKAGVRAMGRVLAAELAPRGIRVNIVTPGGISTPFWSGVAPTPEALAELEKRSANSIPLGRLDQADEVARTVLFLASDDASNIQAA